MSLVTPNRFYFFFDMDGTLCDSEQIYALSLKMTIKTITGVDISDAKASEYAHGRSVRAVIEKVLFDFSVDSIHTNKFYLTIADTFKNLKREHSEKFLIAPTVDLFKYLVHEGHPVCVVSGSLRQDISEVLTLINIGKEIPFFGDEDYMHGKPSPEPYLTAANYYNIPTNAYKNIIVVEDSPVGVRSGRDAGMHVIGLQSSSSVSLLNEGAHKVFLKKDIGAEMGSIQTINLIAEIQVYLQTLI